MTGPAGGAQPLRVRVNDELVLEAGTCRSVASPEGPQYRIDPPAITLFHQVLGYLRGKPDPPRRGSGTQVGREGVAAAAVAVRWGSYFAVLADRNNPLWAGVRAARTSQISDAEMARINIEASAALAEWIDLYRRERGGGLYERLVERAVRYLPMPQHTAKPRLGPLSPLDLTRTATADLLVQAAPAERLARARAEAQRFPTRVLANALVNVAWRNGPVEDIHAGLARGYPLARRRVTPAEERALMRFASDGMALAMSVCLLLATERPARPWPEQVLPYALASMRLITPSGWTLTEASRAVCLPA
jgi:hypothetical protein